MKTTFQKLVIALAFLGSLTLVPFGVYAADNEVGLVLSYSTINEDGVENGFGYGISYTRVIMPNVAVEAGIERKTFDLEDVDGDITAMPILVTGQYRFKAMGAVRPWIGGGIGYYINDIDDSFIEDEADLLTEEECTDFGLDCEYSASVDLDNALGFHLGVGADYLLTDSLALAMGLEYRFISADAEFSFDCTGTDCVLGLGDLSTTEDTDLGGFDLNLGIKYIF